MKTFILAITFLATATIVAAIEEPCTQIPDSCPINNGFVQYCFCQPHGSGCQCRCPYNADPVNGTCEAKPTKLFEPCRFVGSCSLIPESDCFKDHQCQCSAARYAVNDLTACIRKPVLLNQPCSDYIGCEALPGATCTHVLGESHHECKCQEPMFPNYDNKECIPSPKAVGEFCSAENPCTHVPFSTCVVKDPTISNQPTCECPNEFMPSDDGYKCQATRIGARCTAESTCEKIDGSTCVGSPEESICLCVNSMATPDLTRCV